MSNEQEPTMTDLTPPHGIERPIPVVLERHVQGGEFTHDEIVELGRWVAETTQRADDVVDAISQPWNWWAEYVESFAPVEPEPDYPYYPDVEVSLVGQDGNTGAIMDQVVRGLRAYGVSMDMINKFRREVMSGDYKNVLATVNRWVTVV